MKSLATHMKESFNESIIDLVIAPNDKDEEVVETDTSTKEEPAD